MRGRFGALLDTLGHPFFGTLSKEKRQRIIEYLNEPSLERWAGNLGISRIIIGQRGNYFTTIFVAVMEIDSTFDGEIASRFKYPDALTVARALQQFAKNG